MNVGAEAARPQAIPHSAECYRTIGPFDADSFPAGLRTMHRLKEGAWGLLELSAGTITFVWDDEAGGRQTLTGPAQQVVPPVVPHHVEADGPFSVTIGFYRLPR